MGRPLNKRLFGTPKSTTNTIKVQFFNGTASVPGYIVKQKGAKWFQCKDADGNVAVCKVVDKASADLALHEMTITVKYDNLDVDQVTKIAGRNVTVKGHQQHWTFDPSTTDGYVQMEEAGDDTSLTNGVDLEGDDIAYTLPAGMSLYEPLEGSGGSNATVPGLTYKLTGASSTLNASAAARGTPYAPGSNVASVTNSAAGLYREKYVGNLWSTYGAFSEFDIAWFNDKTRGPFKGAAATTYAGFANRTDLGAENNYTLMWRGYVQAPATGTFSIWTDGTDDDAAVWIGTDALTPTYANMNASATGNRVWSTNSVTLTAGQWYPIRMVFTEFGGSENCQWFLQDVTHTTLYAGPELTFAYNTATKGY